ncbi:hypothetical protein N7467_001191 [Penicillium canescens]|nr:hypothetical protein N7467_001191 [Penicillium canescens]
MQPLQTLTITSEWTGRRDLKGLLGSNAIILSRGMWSRESDTGQVDVNSTSSEGRTSLSWAVEGGDKAVVQLLEQSDGHRLQDSEDAES